MRTVVAGVLILVLFGCVALLVGCGGSSDGTPPSQTQGGTIRGAVNTAGGEEYDVYLNGQLVPGAMQEDGSFVIEGVPPGNTGWRWCSVVGWRAVTPRWRSGKASKSNARR